MKLWKNIFISVVVGIIVGVITILGQKVLPAEWNWIANSGSVWLIPPFFVAALAKTKRQSVVVGIINLLSILLGYYGYAILIRGNYESLYYLLLWIIVGLISGTIFGIAGFLWNKDNTWKHKFGSALIGGVFISEGIFIVSHWNDYSHMIASGFIKIAIGIILILILERSKKDRVSSMLMTIPVILLGSIGYLILNLFA